MSRPPLYDKQDFRRRITIAGEDPEGWRSVFRRDYARLLHSPVFRRLQGKTQLLSGLESDFVRNRLTHSLEVAQIAKSIALRLNAKQNRRDRRLDLDLIEFAGLAHDLGHAPFGHTGEYALNARMRKHGGFEGNAQTLHILSRLEKRLDDVAAQRRVDEEDQPIWFKDGQPASYGLNLCARTLAAIIKYDHKIPPELGEGKFYKGYYASDADVVEHIRDAVIPGCTLQLSTLECQIMDLADDIAYSTYDLEDMMKSGLAEPLDVLFPARPLLEKIAERARKGLSNDQFSWKDAHEALHRCLNSFKQSAGINLGDSTLGVARALSKTSAADGFNRTQITSTLVNRFMSGVEVVWSDDQPKLSRVRIPPDLHAEIESLKHFTYLTIIDSSRLKIVAHRATFIVNEIMNSLTAPLGFSLLPPDFAEMYGQAANSLPLDEDHKPEENTGCMRVICDFVAGMTDRYAVEFFCRLRSENYQTIFRNF